jgi:cation:H+ antiporter
MKDMDIILFLLSLGIILLGCELFTNSVEWTGKRFKLSEGAVGSVLAAVGTALPETIIPIIAILFIGGDAGHEIGTGAILGAPFMLATLALFVCGLSVLIFAKRRGTKTLHLNSGCIRRDLKFFLAAYALAAIAALAPPEFNWFKVILGFLLIPLYGAYVWYTFKTGVGECADDELKPLYCHDIVTKIRGRRDYSFEHVDDPVAGKLDRLRVHEPSTPLIFFQMAVALLAIIVGANMFIGQINALAEELGVAAAIMALLVTPIATELPEKFNSFLWIKDKKDTFALGNITGAMVFQSCIPVTIGIVLTNWHLNLSNGVEMLQAASIGIALLSGAVLYLESRKSEMKMSGLFFGGVLYLIFIILVLATI